MHELWYTFKIVYPKMNFIYIRYRSILIGIYTQNFAVEHKKEQKYVCILPMFNSLLYKPKIKIQEVYSSKPPKFTEI